MDDCQVIQLFFERDEKAIIELSQKYGYVCRKIADNILNNDLDSEECISDTYLTVWNTIPPECPNNLLAYVSKITRNIALKRLRYNMSAKRDLSSVVPLSEFEEILPYEEQTEEENSRIGKAISDFLRAEKEDARIVFIRKYWYFDSVAEIADRYSFSESKVKSMLFHTRRRLASYLKKEGIGL